jgi:hypothetical protein
MGQVKGLGRARSSKKTSDTSGERMSAALASLHENITGKVNYSATARKFDVKMDTLRNRFLGKHKSAFVAHQQQRLLTTFQEDVLVDWMCYQAEEGRPWGREKIKLKVDMLTGKKPSDHWVKAFMSRHKNTVKFCGTSGLDPKRAQAFNRTNIADHFKQLGDAISKYKYRIILNFDETGMQRGGGRKRTGKKHFIGRHSRARYRKRDANLELVTIVECACNDGTMLDPGFIFQGKTWDEDWFSKHKGIS